MPQTFDPFSLLWSLILFAIWILLPLLPAILIFKLFPTDKVTVSGPFQNLTINVTGAFAAYFITLLVGWILVERIDLRIQEHQKVTEMDRRSRVSPVYEVVTNVRFVDPRGNEIDPGDLLADELRIVIIPPLETKALPKVSFRLPLTRPDEWPSVQFWAHGFKTRTVPLGDLLKNKKASRSEDDRRVVLSEDVVLQVDQKSGNQASKVTARSYLQSTNKGPTPIEGPEAEKFPSQ